MDQNDADPKGLVRESFRIDGITLSECRSIFLDWALSLGDAATVPTAIHVLMAQYADQKGHPMLGILAEGLVQPATTGRRGGRAARVGGA